MSKLNYIFNFIRKNTRYFLAALAIVLMFLVSRSFPSQVITSESCAGGTCQAVLNDPVLSQENPSYYANDVMKSSPGQYYRLTFLARANRDTKLEVIATNPSDNDKELETLELKKSSKDLPQEIVFASDGDYSDILFRKTDAHDGADIDVTGVLATKLEIHSEKELSGLQPTIRGEIDASRIDQSQTDNSYAFNQLKDPDTILGQVFKPQADYIASVTLDLDIVKQDNNGGKKYKFELREADLDGGVPDISSNVLSSVSFTAENIERYRQDDGKFNFPILAKLASGKYYFIGINNNNVAVDKFNYLRLKGTSDSGKYENGTVAIKTKGKTYSAVGNLYFVTHQLNFREYQGKKVLGGALIEDIGRPKGFYTYKPMGNIYDAADLEEYSGAVEYDDDKDALVGTIAPGIDSSMTYKFETIFPANRISVSGLQADADWSQVSVLYSYDKADWKEIPDNVADDSNGSVSPLQNFDYSWDVRPAQDAVYIKIIPKNSAGKEEYGLKDFQMRAEILMR